MYKIFSLEQCPHLQPQIDRLSEVSWPKFLVHGDVLDWSCLFGDFARFQILFCEPEDNVIAVGHTIPLSWDGTVEDLPSTIEAILLRAKQSLGKGCSWNTFSALAAMVYPSHQGRGLSSELLKAMKSLAARNGCSSLIAPVRPTEKASYPLTPFEHYVNWTRADGAPFDSWIRVHWRIGAKPLIVAPKALTVTGRIADWELWTGMHFPESGPYVVPGALQPVEIDVAADQGRYEDPNYWMYYSVTKDKAASESKSCIND